LVLLLLIIYSEQSRSQSDIIFKALSDELQRNMKELGKEEEYEPPFFMEFGLSDYSYNLISASLGSVSSQRDGRKRNKSVRVMVGDYQLSDENFEDNTNNPNYNDGNLVVPLENDYLALRRSYWISANNVFKNASELYRNKTSAMKLKGLTTDDLPAPDLSREEPVVYKKAPANNDFDNQTAIKRVKELSKVFANYPEIHFSQVSLFHIILTEYKVNSEGTGLSLPFTMYFLHVAAVMPDEDLHPIWQQMVYYSKNFNEFPPKDQIIKDINGFAENLKDEANAIKFSEKYIGPLMLEGKSVVEDGFMNLFGPGNESLLASRSPIVNDGQDGVVVPNIQTWENRFDKRVIDRKISIMDISTLKEYKDQSLLGHFIIDNQGVKPKDTILLIDNGILKSQLVNRTPTTKQDKSTGHMRIGMTERGAINMLSPGVIKIKAEEGLPKEEIKDKLIEMGREEGLDFVLYAKPISTSANINPVNFYQIDVNTGEEILLRGIRFRLEVNDLRDIEYISSDEIVYNTLFYRGRSGYTRGVPVSFISPDAMVIKETQISGDVNTIKGELPLVPSPLNIEHGK